MKFLSKYLLFILLLANMTSEYILFAPISEVLFYGVLAISIPVLFQFGFLPKGSYAKAPEICILIFTYLFAQFVLQTDLLTLPNILYTVSKVVIFCILILCIGRNFDFYLKKAPEILSFSILAIVSLGWFYNTYTGEFHHLTFGFVNRNTACTIATAGFAGFIFMRERLRMIDYLAAAVLFITVLYGGSRNAMVMCILIVMVKYGFSFKLITSSLILFLFIIYVLPMMGIEATAWERVIGTIDGSVDVDRETVREIAWRMIKVRPLTGWGYRYEILPSIAAEMKTNLNGHNGYLVTIENLGWPCGLLALSCIVIGSIKSLRLYLLKNRYINFHLSIVVSTIFAANQESYFIGVNQFTTNMFFMSFVVLGMARYIRKRKNNLNVCG